jgi:hypothetical protein
MTEHYTRNTLEATSWCKKCQKFTQHRVDGGRLGPCLEQHNVPDLTKEQAARRKKEEDRRRQAELFPGMFK